MAQTLININGDIRDAASLTVPADRVFRGAWQFNGAAVEIDMTKARDIHRDNLRAERAPKLAALDVAYMKALEQGGDTAAIAAEKQALRDVTADARIANAATPDALKALTLDALLGEELRGLGA
jgi:hypothetical protein